MENSTLRMKITMEIENLIAKSCVDEQAKAKFNAFHIALLKKYYTATDVSIDHHRKRVKMDIVLNNDHYDPQTINTFIPTFHANMLFKNFEGYLKSCIEKDTKSLSVYAGLLRTFTKKEVTLTIA